MVLRWDVYHSNKRTRQWPCVARGVDFIANCVSDPTRRLCGMEDQFWVQWNSWTNYRTSMILAMKPAWKIGVTDPNNKNRYAIDTTTKYSWAMVYQRSRHTYFVNFRIILEYLESLHEESRTPLRILEGEAPVTVTTSVDAPRENPFAAVALGVSTRTWNPCTFPSDVPWCNVHPNSILRMY